MTKLRRARRSYKKQKNYCRLYKKEKKKVLFQLRHDEHQEVLENYESNKSSISLIDGDDIIQDDLKVVEMLNSSFEDAILSVGINEPGKYISNTMDARNAIPHRCIIKIDNFLEKFTFFLNQIEERDIEMEIMGLDSKKASMYEDIPSKILKANSVICCCPIETIINCGIHNCTFEGALKYADITPIHKKGDCTEVSNYRPVSMLPILSKIFERVLQKQINRYMEIYLSPFLCGYRKGFNPQHIIFRKMAYVSC